MYKDTKGVWSEYTDAQIYITEAEISRLFRKDVLSKISHLKAYFSYLSGNQFYSLPIEAQEALIDMVFNMGAGGLKRKFKAFNAAMANGDYLKTSQECRRARLQPSRNAYVKQLLIKAANQSKALAK